jgi:hypothetical protein
MVPGDGDNLVGGAVAGRGSLTAALCIAVGCLLEGIRWCALRVHKITYDNE